eukprot:403368209
MSNINFGNIDSGNMKIHQLELDKLRSDIHQLKDQTKSEINEGLFKKQRQNLAASNSNLQSSPNMSKKDFRLIDNELGLDLQSLNNKMFEIPSKEGEQPSQAQLNKKKYTHKNQYLLTVDDLNLGEEVAFSINSIEQDKNTHNSNSQNLYDNQNQTHTLSANSLKHQKFQQLLEKQEQQKKLKRLSNFVNKQMERIMLSKMNSEVQAMYVSGHNKYEGTIRDIQEKKQLQRVQEIREENEVYQKQKRQEINQKLRQIHDFKQKLVFNKQERSDKKKEDKFIETLVYKSGDKSGVNGSAAGFYSSRKIYINDLNFTEAVVDNSTKNNDDNTSKSDYKTIQKKQVKFFVKRTNL